jgi:flavodoxin
VNSIVIYGSRHGNTRKIAEAIAGGLRRRGPVQLIAADAAPSVLPKNTDLVVVGGPTEGHRMTEPIARFFDRIDRGALKGTPAAGFDTRLRWPLWLSGSAGAGITARLRQSGAQVIAPELSFFVAGKYPALEPGELERATAWGASLADKVEARVPAEVVC